MKRSSATVGCDAKSLTRCGKPSRVHSMHKKNVFKAHQSYPFPRPKKSPPDPFHKYLFLHNGGSLRLNSELHCVRSPIVGHDGSVICGFVVWVMFYRCWCMECTLLG